MSTQPLPRRPRVIGQRKTFAIVASMYNEKYVNGLLEGIKSEILSIMPSASVPLYHVPGAWEIPVTAEFVLEHTNADVVIAVGVIIQGETSHANLIGTAVCQKLQDLATGHLVPVVNCVLCVENEAQAHQRCLVPERNRGVECARTAMHMVELFMKLHTAYQPNRKKEAEPR